MHSFIDSKIDPPNNWAVFEEMIADIFTKEWGDISVVRYGRTGQKQKGIDIINQDISKFNGYYGIQCKNKNLTEKEIEKIVEEVKEFEPKLSKLIIATTMRRDQKILGHVMKISKNHFSNSLFSVEIYFWEDLKSMLANHPSLLSKYYPHYSNDTYDKVKRLILNSSIDSWLFDDEEGVYTLKTDVKLVIKREKEHRDFYEKWVENFADKKAYMTIYYIYYNNSLIKKELFVDVDGFRMSLPLPSSLDDNDLTISEYQYKLCMIINGQFRANPPFRINQYIAKAGIKVKKDI